MEQRDVAARLVTLERQVRLLKLAIVAPFLVLLTVAASAWQSGQEKVLRTEALIIVDSLGRDRVVVGAPIPELKGRRIAPSTGLVINDATGAERFAVGLLDTGHMVMGFDAPPGTGTDGNRERITISAGARGGAEIRFLNQRALVAAHMSLFNDGEVALFFTSYTPDGTLVHRVSAKGDTVALHPH